MTESVTSEDALAQFANDDPVSPPVIEPPADGPVHLPGGFRRLKGVGGPAVADFETVTKAWVKELDGYAEEKIDKARRKDDFVAYMDAILESGVERLGDNEPTLEDLRNLLVGDRDFLLMEISRATYGDQIEYDDFVCPHCQETLSFTLNLDEIPVTRLDSPRDAEFNIELRNDVVPVHLPTGGEQAYAQSGSSDAEISTRIIAAALGGDEEYARSLSVRDRKTILKELAEKSPGPRYNDVKFTHPECGNEIRLAVSLADLFRGI